MYIREEILSDGYTLDIYMVKSEFEVERIARYNFKYNEGSYKDKDLKSFKTLENKLWKDNPKLSLGINLRIIEKCKQAGKQAMKHQKKIWDYQEVARKLKSENNYSDEILKKLFSWAAELEKYLIANNLENEIIMM
ncbi:MAG TPA: hypothetical protein DEP72_06390 [Clostridiales bacterium]|nr:hypothetical protein [Clostridiales bacterium]